MDDKKNDNIDKNLFVFTEKKLESTSVNVIGSKKHYFDSMKKFSKNKSAMFGLVFFIAILLMSIIVPFLSSTADPFLIVPEYTHQGPSASAPFGYDAYGRDLWSRVWYGMLYSILLATVSTIFMITFAILVGIGTGTNRKLDGPFQYFTKITHAIPAFIILILLTTTFQASFWILVLGMVVTTWIEPSQQIRAQVKKYQNTEFMIASKTLGTSEYKNRLTF